MDQESFAQIQLIVGTADEVLRADIADAKRHTGVLTEGLRHELQLVAEGFQMHLDRRHTDDRAYLDEQFRETRALIERPLFFRLSLEGGLEGLPLRVSNEGLPRPRVARAQETL